jgi:hypothetical protein
MTASQFNQPTTASEIDLDGDISEPITFHGTNMNAELMTVESNQSKMARGR